MNSRLARFILIYAFIMLFASWIAWEPSAARDLWLELASALRSESELFVSEERWGDWSVYDLGADVQHIHVIQRDAAGLMWVAADRRLLRFDGRHWVDGKSQLLEPWPWEIQGLGVTPDAVYVGLTRTGRDGGIGVYDRSAEIWSITLAGEGQLNWGGIRGIATDAQGTVLLPTAGGTIIQVNGEQWQERPMPIPFGEDPPLNHDGLLDPAGRYWLATDRGIWELQSGTWAVHPTPGVVTSLAGDAQGRLWAGTSAGLLMHDIDDTWYHYPPAAYDTGTSWISDVAVDAGGRIWVLTRPGLAIFNGQDWQTISPQVVGSTHWGETLAFDRQGQLWVALPDARIAVFRGQVDIEPFRVLANPPPMEKLPELQLSDERPAGQDVRYPDTTIIQAAALTILFVGAILGAIRVSIALRNARTERNDALGI